jgi:hypothetical protein
MKMIGYMPILCSAWLASAPVLRAESAPDTVAPAASVPTVAPAASAPAPAASVAAAPESDSAKVDPSGLPPVDELESKVRSTLLFGGSSPVSFSGEARLRIQEHDYYNYPAYLAADQTWTQANWEGNESMLRLAMVVHANRNAVLWSKIGFQNTLPGIYINRNAAGSTNPDGFTKVQNRHDKSDATANIQEDMAAGLAIRTVPASFWVRMGNVLWTESSPLTIWKAQPRTFAWDYLPYEIEQPIGRYYEYNIAKGEKSGRAAWNKKAFNGIDFRSIDLPLGFQTSLMWADFERYDNFEREYLDYSNDLALAQLANDTKQVGIGDSFRHMYNARVANTKILDNFTLSLNAVGIRFKSDIAEVSQWRKVFGVLPISLIEPATTQRKSYVKGSGFYKEPDVFSFEARGAVNDKLEIHTDLALSMMDTVWVNWSVDSTQRNAATLAFYNQVKTRTHTSADPVPAFYARINSKYGIPVQTDLAYIPKGFYSPFSFAAPVDGFFPVGSNLVGTGKFIGRGEASPYTQNMAGVFLSVSPPVGYGHLRLAYGQHFQPEKAQDVLYFPYRLNGQDFNSTIQSSYNRWGNSPVFHSLGFSHTRGTHRLGDESFVTTEYNAPTGYAGGAVRSDYLSMFESFVPYENAAQADANLNTVPSSNVMAPSPFVPHHQKYSFNLEADGAWDIAPLIGYGHDLFLSGYAALNGVSSTLQAVAFSPESMMLWGYYLRAEPAIALSDKFYILGLAGYEVWRSDMAYTDALATDGSATAVKAPIDYRDWAFGGGFDYDFAARVGFHFRYKWMKHEDKTLPANTWATPLVSGEIKMWF